MTLSLGLSIFRVSEANLFHQKQKKSNSKGSFHLYISTDSSFIVKLGTSILANKFIPEWQTCKWWGKRALKIKCLTILSTFLLNSSRKRERKKFYSNKTVFFFFFLICLANVLCAIKLWHSVKCFPPSTLLVSLITKNIFTSHYISHFTQKRPYINVCIQQRLWPADPSEQSEPSLVITWDI